MIDVAHWALFVLYIVGECSSPCLNGGQCVHPDSCNCTLYQATGTHCQTGTVDHTGKCSSFRKYGKDSDMLWHRNNRWNASVPNLGFEREMTCRSWGQYNYETFDGLYYFYPGKCSYTLLRECEDSPSSVHIQVNKSFQSLEAMSYLDLFLKCVIIVIKCT